jgi:hypothetical protein
MIGIYSDSVYSHTPTISSGWSIDPYVLLDPNDDGDGDYTINMAWDIGTLAPGESADIYFKYRITYPSRLFVDSNALPGGSGLTWYWAYQHLQDALADANSNSDVNEIWVAQGIYTPDSNSAEPNGSGDRAATFQLINGVALRGGYAGYGAPDPNASDIELYETILSGDLDGNDTQGLDPCDLMNDPNRGENSYHVVKGSGIDSTAILDGFTISGGNANSGSFPHYHGGGMFNWTNANPMVTNCTFIANSANSGGGGMRNEASSNPTLNNCAFYGNSAGYGGGIHNGASDPNITNCTFSGNSARRGGGIFNHSTSSPMVSNCTFSGNWAEYDGTGDGGGIANANTTHPIVKNCILWGNTAPDGNEISLLDSSTIDVNYCDIRGGQTDIYNGGGGTVNWGINIDADPLFIDANGPDGQIGTEDDNLRPSLDSPCIDAGDNNSVPVDTQDFDNDGNMIEPIPYDLDGRPRIVDGDCNDTYIVDMGAYEFDWTYIGDFEGDCDVDYGDLDILAGEWLISSPVTVSKVAPATPVLWYDFDDGSGVTADNSGSEGGSYDGNLMPACPNCPFWTTVAFDGNALQFDGDNDYVEIPALNLDTNNLTISAWIKADGEQGIYAGIVSSRDQDSNEATGLAYGSAGAGTGFVPNQELCYYWNQDYWPWHSGLFIPADQWVFVAVVVEPNQATLYLGENGVLYSATNEAQHGLLEQFDSNSLSQIGDDDHEFHPSFRGIIDDVRISNYSLTPGEIAYVSDISEMDVPLLADINGDDKVDLRDYAIMANHWLLGVE